MAKNAEEPGKADVPADENEWELRLYVAGKTAKTERALKNLQTVCKDHLKGRCTIEVIDLEKNPQMAHEEQIFAVPTLVRRLPEPVRKIIGDLTDTDKVLVGLDVKQK